MCALPRLALRTCAVQRLLSARRAWQILWGSCALVENKAHRLLECLTDSYTLLGVLRRDCWCGHCSLIITLHDNTITMAATSWAVCRCSLRPVNQQRHGGDLEVSASFLSERLDCHVGALFRSISLHSPVASRLGGWESQVSPATTSSAPNQTAYAACTPALVRRLCPVS